MINKKNQCGLSLIEIMVTLVISSLLLLAVSKVYIDNRRSYLFQQNKSENQENQRYALLLLHQHLTKTGYLRNLSTALETTFPEKNIDNCNFKKEKSIQWHKKGDNGNDKNVLCIRYQPRDKKDRDCLGNTFKNIDGSLDEAYKEPKQTIVERFQFDLETKATLECKSLHDRDQENDLNNPPNELISEIIDLRFEFGVEKGCNNEINGEVNCYKQQNDINDTDNILAIRYTILTRGSNHNIRDSGTSLDEALKKWKDALNIQASDPAFLAIKNEQESNDPRQDKNYIYQVLQGTVALRNRLP